jgi:LacI family transcriptional regulator
MERKPATIKEIAKQLNVSVSTVSRALHDHPSIGLRTKMQVRKLAEELNYEPNQAAISFKLGKTSTIGLILPRLSEEFFSIAVNAVEDIAIRNGYTVLIGQSHDDIEREKQIVETMRKHRVDGILVSLAIQTDNFDHFEALEKYNIPLVFFDRVPTKFEGYTVTCSLKNSSAEMIDWLQAKDHRRIGFITGVKNMDASKERLEGYREGLQRNNIAFDEGLVVSSDLTSNGNKGAIERLLSLPQRPTAVIAFNDYVALDCIKYSRDRGLKINKDILFLSYANIPMLHYMLEPPMVTVEQFPYEQAEKATEMLIGLINAKENPDTVIERKVVMESKLVSNL